MCCLVVDLGWYGGCCFLGCFLCLMLLLFVCLCGLVGCLIVIGCCLVVFEFGLLDCVAFVGVLFCFGDVCGMVLFVLVLLVACL